MNAALEFVEQHSQRFVEELVELLRIPSISAVGTHRDDVTRCATWLVEHFTQIGLENVRLMPTAGNPVVYAEWLHAIGQPTVLIYGHYDVQPVDPVHEWESPPFEPTVRGGQIFARGAADDKGQVFMHAKAVEALLRTQGRLPVNVKLLIEGEEEIGSPNLDAFVAANRDQLAADVVVISDTAMFPPGIPAITYGLRGLAYCQVEVEGPTSDLHSGTYGGGVANPLEVLCKLLASLKDENGRVVVPGFYDDVDPLSEQERHRLADLDFDEERLKREVGVEALAGEAGFSVLERVWARPTLELNGVWGGFTGEGAKTVIPARAWAKISCRLVPRQDPERVLSHLERHLRAICPDTVRLRFTNMHGGRPGLVPTEHPAIQAAFRALEQGFKVRPVFIRAGGSIPVVATFHETLHLPVVLMGVANHDDHAHAPNERFGLENFIGGIRSATYLWEELARSALA
jgi:acetylornithine deacetylase/succinyl-diaminopimelate desuccinylase-like protein